MRRIAIVYVILVQREYCQRFWYVLFTCFSDSAIAAAMLALVRIFERQCHRNDDDDELYNNWRHEDFIHIRQQKNVL